MKTILSALICSFVIVFSGALSFSADSPEKTNKEFLDLIKSTYDFSPSKLTDKQRSDKSKQMDKVWDLMDSNPATYLPFLRQSLADRTQNAFFYFDGSRLLLKYSEAKEDLELAFKAILRADIKEVDESLYFKMIHLLGIKGVDTYPAVEKLLNTPDFKIFLVEHAMTLAQSDCVLYLLLTQDDTAYLDKLIARLKSEKNPVSQKTLVICIAFTVTEKGQKAIGDFKKTVSDVEVKKACENYSKLEDKSALPRTGVKSDPKYLMPFLKAYCSRKYESKEFKAFDEKDAPYLVKKEDYAELKKMRKKQAERVSDEALGEIGFLTTLLQYAYTSKD